jgi:hypothetical protein
VQVVGAILRVIMIATESVITTVPLRDTAVALVPPAGTAVVIPLPLVVATALFTMNTMRTPQDAGAIPAMVVAAVVAVVATITASAARLDGDAAPPHPRARTPTFHLPDLSSSSGTTQSDKVA